MSDEKKMIDFAKCRQELAAALRKIDPEYDSADPRTADSALLRDAKINEAQLMELYSRCCGVVPIDENEFSNPERYPDAPVEFLSAYCCVPYEWSEDTITFLVPDPYDLEELDYQVRRTWGMDFAFRFARRPLIERVLSKQQSDDENEEGAIALDDENALRTMAGEARIVRLVNDIFTQAIELGASDIHIEPGEELVSVRCRVDGVLTEIMTSPLKDFPAIASRIKLIGGLNIAESRLPQDGRTNVQLGRMELDMRISTIPILTGESIVLRLLNQEAVSFDLGSLGMSPYNLEQFEKLIKIPHGIILVVGPTGSGKTTTLYSVINQLNDQKRKIITIEDPVEYKTPGLCQVQVNPKVGVTFAAGLRSIVRQDPDVILVGEIRDRETADIAINAALTGHLVLSTLHTNDAVGAVTRLLDMGVENFLVSSALSGVLSQRLVRKICTDCHGSGEVDSRKCKRCNGSGFKGRCGIFELLIVEDELRGEINRNASSSELEKIAVKHGMKTLREDGDAKVAAGITTQMELNRSTAEM